MMTGDDYRASLRDGRRIFYDGELVEDVTVHPRMQGSVDLIAAGYDAYVEQGPDAFAAAYTAPRSSEELRARLDLLTKWDTSLVTTLESLAALRTAAGRIGETEVPYGHRMEAYIEWCQENDVRCVQTLTDAKGHRDRSIADQDDPDVFTRVVEQRPDGVVIRGAKLHISAAAITHEMVVMPTKKMKTGEEPWAIACAIPVNAPGVTVLNASISPRLEELEEHPYSKTRSMPEGFVVFEDVFVPNERIFLNGEVEHSATFAHSLGLWQRAGGIAHMAKNYDLLIGLARLLAEANGTERIGHVKDKIAEMVIHATLVRSGLEAAITNVTTTPEGWVTPSELYTNAAKFFGAREFPRMLSLIHDIGGGSIVTAPLPGDLANPETRPLVEKYMRTMEGVSGEYRTRLFHAVRDITASDFGGWWQVTVSISGGGLYAQKLITMKHYDMNHAKELALEAAGLQRFNR
jgi:4-hydroxybutyryl-CoA dehydratase/vinylacetyl-CoA-Delta-isomerase